MLLRIMLVVTLAGTGATPIGAAEKQAPAPGPATGPAIRTAGPRLQFRLLAEPGKHDEAVDVFPDPLDPGGQSKIRVRRDVIVSEFDVSSVRLSEKDAAGQREILLDFTEAAGRRMHDVTKANVGGSLAIVFDGKLIARVAIRTPVAGNAAITAGKDERLFDPDAIVRAIRDAKAAAGPATRP